MTVLSFERNPLYERINGIKNCWAQIFKPKGVLKWTEAGQILTPRLRQADLDTLIRRCSFFYLPISKEKSIFCTIQNGVAPFLGKISCYRWQITGLSVLRLSKSHLERGQNPKTTRNVSFGVQGCVCAEKESEMATIHDQRLDTHPSLNSPGFAVLFTPSPLKRGFLGLSHLK